MYLNHLSLTNFRSFTRLDMDFPRRVVLLTGSNAQGKTSMLEAIYFLAAFSSFQTHTDRQLVNFIEARKDLAVGRLVAEYTRGPAKHRLEARLVLEPVGATGQRLRKEILLDGVKRNATDAIGHFNAVIFLPQMTRIIEQGPEERRRYLNLALSQVVPGYALALGEYNQALTQRNALLKQLSERIGGDQEQLTFWDELVSRRGAQLMQARILAVRDLERLAARIHNRLTHSNEVLRLVYQPAYEPLSQPTGQYSLPITTPVDRTGLSIDQIREGFCQKLKELRNEEISRGMTTIGPHRDELRFLSNGIDLGNYGSRGQVRTTLLAIKLAEVAWMKEKTGQSPVLLLDEILAELDIQRRADLLEALEENEQGLLTTTDLKLFTEGFTRQAALWEVQGGAIRAIENRQ